VPHTLIADNAAGHLLQRGLVDAVIVGADRVTARGDVANKIGTYLKALAAQAHAVPFYVALPTSALDYRLTDGIGESAIEQRSAGEVTHVIGRAVDGCLQAVEIAPPGSAAWNDAFEVTPAHRISALITERGVVSASVEGLCIEASSSCEVYPILHGIGVNWSGVGLFALLRKRRPLLDKRW
jgi:methylthioribose-1-phosphate isomerase